jgi:hypothetical protein
MKDNLDVAEERALRFREVASRHLNAAIAAVRG